MTPATSRSELEQALATAAFNAYYRFRLHEFGGGECTIEAPFRDEFERPGGAVSGPVFMAAADVAIWLAVVTHRGTEETWETADLKTAFLRALRCEPFRCTARVLKLGQRLVHAVAEGARGRNPADTPRGDVRANAGRARRIGLEEGAMTSGRVRGGFNQYGFTVGIRCSDRFG